MPPHIRHADAKVDGTSAGISAGAITQQNVGVMASIATVLAAVLPGCSSRRALALTSSHAYADTFQEMWMGRIARPPADDQKPPSWKQVGRAASFSGNESPARTARSVGTIFVVTNLGRQEDSLPGSGSRPLRTRPGSRLSLGAARQIGYDNVPVTVPCGYSDRNSFHLRLSPCAASLPRVTSFAQVRGLDHSRNPVLVAFP